jgi:hypothetical protein
MEQDRKNNKSWETLLKFLKEDYKMVAKGGIEPPTQGFFLLGIFLLTRVLFDELGSSYIFPRRRRVR